MGTETTNSIKYTIKKIKKMQDIILVKVEYQEKINVQKNQLIVMNKSITKRNIAYPNIILSKLIFINLSSLDFSLYSFLFIVYIFFIILTNFSPNFA
jgi:hypothetical protein